MSALLWLLEGWLPKREVTRELVAEPELKPLFFPSPRMSVRGIGGRWGKGAGRMKSRNNRLHRGNNDILI